MTFYDVVTSYSWDDVTKKIYSSTPADVERALSKEGNIALDDFMALISPAADAYLESMARKSMEITRRRFGNVMQVYTPLYISNYCSNRCVYCGFNCGNKIKRITLSQEEIAEECMAIRQHPFRHLLLVTGESKHHASLEYLGESIKTSGKYFEQTSIEVQPMDVDDYKYLMDKGLHSVYVYQETYNEKRYPVYHLAGNKANYRYRLETPDRLGEAGVYKIGVGNLIGLEEWRTDAFFTALHVNYLENKYWRTKCSISFPRLRPFVGEGFQPNYPANERGLLQLICAYRLMSENVELSMSTRESPYFRDNIMNLGITTMSAGSKTAPGGYSDYEKNKELEQFSVNDDRSVEDTIESIRKHQLEPVWKDWSLFMQTSAINNQ